MPGQSTIVQVASERSLAAAQSRASAPRGKNDPAGVIRSDDYRELRRGWWVVHVGPYATGSHGKAAATRVAKRLNGSHVRHVTPRT